MIVITGYECQYWLWLPLLALTVITGYEWSAGHVMARGYGFFKSCLSSNDLQSSDSKLNVSVLVQGPRQNFKSVVANFLLIDLHTLFCLRFFPKSGGAIGQGWIKCTHSVARASEQLRIFWPFSEQICNNSKLIRNLWKQVKIGRIVINNLNISQLLLLFSTSFCLFSSK